MTQQTIPTTGDVVRAMHESSSSRTVLNIKPTPAYGAHWYVTLVQVDSSLRRFVEYATYVTFSDGSCSQGHYFTNLEDAQADFDARS